MISTNAPIASVMTTASMRRPPNRLVDVSLGKGALLLEPTCLFPSAT